ncbi:MAG: hypothetical protein V4661_10865 [Pseudomonadota bacterium]
MSGRSLSLTNDVAADGSAFVEVIRQLLKDPSKPSKTFGFVGVAYSSPTDLRAEIGPRKIKSDVIHTPIAAPDPFASPAHADFVTFGSTDADLDEIRTWLQERLKVLRAASLGQIARLCGSTQDAIQIIPGAVTASSGVGTFNQQSGVALAKGN